MCMEFSEAVERPGRALMKEALQMLLLGIKRHI
jgi:hypothetical protein